MVRLFITGVIVGASIVIGGKKMKTLMDDNREMACEIKDLKDEIHRLKCRLYDDK